MNRNYSKTLSPQRKQSKTNRNKFSSKQIKTHLLVVFVQPIFVCNRVILHKMSDSKKYFVFNINIRIINVYVFIYVFIQLAFYTKVE